MVHVTNTGELWLMVLVIVAKALGKHMNVKSLGPRKKIQRSRGRGFKSDMLGAHMKDRFSIVCKRDGALVRSEVLLMTSC